MQNRFTYRYTTFTWNSLSKASMIDLCWTSNVKFENSHFRTDVSCTTPCMSISFSSCPLMEKITPSEVIFPLRISCPSFEIHSRMMKVETLYGSNGSKNKNHVYGLYLRKFQTSEHNLFFTDLWLVYWNLAIFICSYVNEIKLG